MDDKSSVTTSCEEEIVVEGDAHPLDSFGVGLDFVNAFKVRLPDLDGARAVFLADTSKEGFTACEVSNLGQGDLCVA